GKLAGEGMASRPREEMVGGEVHPDQADARGSQVQREGQGHVGGVAGVRQSVRLREVGAAPSSQLEADDMGMADAELELGEQGLRPALLHVAEAIALELAAGVEHHEVGRIEKAADVVDSDGKEALGLAQLVERG